MNKFYTYLYLDPRYSGRFSYGNFITFFYKPRYIGKGTDRRWYVHLGVECTNLQLSGFIKRIIKLGYNPKDYIIKVLENTTSKEAYAYEGFLNKLIGRKDNKTGPLFNHTDGNEGHKNPSKETRELWSKQRTGHKVTKESNKKRSESLKIFYKDINNRNKRIELMKQITSTKEWQENHTKSLQGNNKGRIYIHKGNITKFIKPKELKSYLKDKWILGRTPEYKLQQSIKSKGKNKGKFYIHKDNKKLLISPNEWLEYKEQGYTMSKWYYAKINPKISKFAISIDNIIYSSISQASKKLNINYEILRRRLRRDSFPNYQFLNKDQT